MKSVVWFITLQGPPQAWLFLRFLVWFCIFFSNHLVLSGCVSAWHTFGFTRNNLAYTTYSALSNHFVLIKLVEPKTMLITASHSSFLGESAFTAWLFPAIGDIKGSTSGSNIWHCWTTPCLFPKSAPASKNLPICKTLQHLFQRPRCLGVLLSYFPSLLLPHCLLFLCVLFRPTASFFSWRHLKEVLFSLAHFPSLTPHLHSHCIVVHKICTSESYLLLLSFLQ